MTGNSNHHVAFDQAKVEIEDENEEKLETKESQMGWKQPARGDFASTYRYKHKPPKNVCNPCGCCCISLRWGCCAIGILFLLSAIGVYFAIPYNLEYQRNTLWEKNKDECAEYVGRKKCNDLNEGIKTVILVSTIPPALYFLIGTFTLIAVVVPYAWWAAIIAAVFMVLNALLNLARSILFLVLLNFIKSEFDKAYESNETLKENADVQEHVHLVMNVVNGILIAYLVIELIFESWFLFCVIQFARQICG